MDLIIILVAVVINWDASPLLEPADIRHKLLHLLKFHLVDLVTHLGVEIYLLVVQVHLTRRYEPLLLFLQSELLGIHVSGHRFGRLEHWVESGSEFRRFPYGVRVSLLVHQTSHVGYRVVVRHHVSLCKRQLDIARAL